MSDDERLASELARLRIHRDDDAAPKPPRRNGADGAARPVGRRGAGAAWVVGLVLLAGAGVGGFYLFRAGQSRVFSSDVELGSISLVSPAGADVKLVATGYVYARKKATVAPKITGRLVRLFVDEGDVVKENQILAELETGDAQAQLAQVRADVAAARARVERARADLADARSKSAREEDLLKRGAGTQSSYDDAKARLVSAQAQLGAAEAEVRSVEARQVAVNVLMENTKVRAPFAGTVIRKLSEIGEVVAVAGLSANGSTTGLFTIADLGDLEVQADVSESQFSRVEVNTPTEILLDAFPDRRFRGKVADIRRTIDRAKASVTVKVRFTDPPKGVLPDMAAKVSFLSKPIADDALAAKPKVAVWKDAVVERGASKVVFVVDENHVKETPVTLGAPLSSLQLELAQGPPPGTRVVRNPPSDLRDGASVKEKKR